MIDPKLEAAARRFIEHSEVDADIYSVMMSEEAGEPTAIDERAWVEALLLEVDRFRAERDAIPPLVAYMRAESGPDRDVAFLRVYAEKVEAGTATAWEIESVVRATLSAIVDRVMGRKK